MLTVLKIDPLSLYPRKVVLLLNVNTVVSNVRRDQPMSNATVERKHTIQRTNALTSVMKDQAMKDTSWTQYRKTANWRMLLAVAIMERIAVVQA